MIEQLNVIGARWAGIFGPMIVQNTLLLLILFLLLHLLRKAPAGIRYVVALIGMVKLLLPPFLPAPAILSASSVTTPLGGNGFFLAFAAPPPSTGTAAASTPTLGAVLFAVWAAAALAYLGVCSLSTLLLFRSLRESTPLLDEESLDLLRKEGIGVYRSDRITMPLTVGLLPRRIFVPPAWESWATSCRRMVIRHELAHIRRLDGLFRVVQIAAQALYFFHPLVHVLSRRVNDYREMACDDLSTKEEDDASVEYSRFLVEIAEAIVRKPASYRSASTLIRRKNELLRRVRYQIREGGLKPMSRIRTFVLLACLVLLVLPLSLYDGTSRSEVIAGEKEGHWSGEKAAQAAAKLTIEKGGEFRFNGVDLEVAELPQALEELAKKSGSKAVLHIHCRDDVAMGTVYKVHQLLTELGLLNVIYHGGGLDGLPLVLPSSDLQKKLVHLSEENVAAVTVDGSGKVLLDGKALPAEKMAKVLSRRLGENEKLVVSLAADSEADYGDFVDTLRLIHGVGANRIAIVPPKGGRA